MEIKTKYEIGQHIWVVYENRGEVCVYDTKIIEISFDKEGFTYYTPECEDFFEEQIVLYEDKDKLVEKIKEIMNNIHKRESEGK